MAASVNTLTLKDAGYPEALRHINPAPKQLFWFGSNPSSWLGRPKVAIVGSRRVSPYGRSVTEKLATQLTESGVVVISGLALGMDAVAHQATLKAGGTTIAVMPGGLDRIYPASHRNLALQIIKQGGALVSEYPAGSEIRKYHFVKRNRIVAGLADVLLITEAALKSGTLHTARFALEQGKTVMAVPGNIDSPGSEGCNNLIKSGAVPVTDVDDVFFALGITPSKKQFNQEAFKGTKTERQILKLISQGLNSQEELALASDLNAATITGVLTTLEIGGYIRPQGNGNWSLA